MPVEIVTTLARAAAAMPNRKPLFKPLELIPNMFPPDGDILWDERQVSACLSLYIPYDGIA
jgi:hypothetical protein